MRAVVIPSFGEPEVLTIREMPDPHPGPQQVSIRVAYVGVNYADILARRNRYHDVELPFVPGMEVSGYIHEVGEDVEGLREGQPVTAFTMRGGYAELVLAQAGLTFPLDGTHGTLDLATAAAFPAVVPTAYDMLTYSAHLQAGETVLIHSAAGGVGSVAGQLARYLGAGLVLGTVGSEQKVCEQVDMALFEEIYPKETIEQCVEQSAFWMQKKRRRRQTNPFTLVWLLIGMGLWSRSNQPQVWKKLLGKLRYLHPKQGQGKLSDSGISRRRRDLGSSCLRSIVQRCCHVLAHRATMPTAFFGRYRLMAIDGTLFKTPDTEANALTFGRSHNQHSKGGYPLVRCVLLSECGSHAVVGLDICDYLTSEQHGAHRLLDQIGPNQLITMDAGITSAGFLERVRSQRAHALGQLEAGVWEHPRESHRLSDGSSIIRLSPTDKKKTKYPLNQPIWVRIIRYQFTDERLGEKGKVYRLVTTLLNPVTAPALALIGLYHERWEVELVPTRSPLVMIMSSCVMVLSKPYR